MIADLTPKQARMLDPVARDFGITTVEEIEAKLKADKSMAFWSRAVERPACRARLQRYLEARGLKPRLVMYGELLVVGTR